VSGAKARVECLLTENAGRQKGVSAGGIFVSLFLCSGNRRSDLRLESGRICVIDELVLYLSEKKHILIDTWKYDRQIVLPIPSSSAGPA
jgi:hypothetical protein